MKITYMALLGDRIKENVNKLFELKLQDLTELNQKYNAIFSQEFTTEDFEKYITEATNIQQHLKQLESVLETIIRNEAELAGETIQAQEKAIQGPFEGE